MVQFRTVRRIRIRSARDPRWLFAFAVAFVLSVAYYGVLIWGAVWLVRTVLASVR